MDWTLYINYGLAALSIIFGAMGWLAPRYTMDKVDLADRGSTMGMSEVRAASGALFVLAGIGALILGTPSAYAMIGFIWCGGAVGRITSLALDGQTRTKWVFAACEVAVAAIAFTVYLISS